METVLCQYFLIIDKNKIHGPYYKFDKELMDEWRDWFPKSVVYMIKVKPKKNASLGEWE